jgi:hypothetical protein
MATQPRSGRLELASGACVVGIDEGQFFPDICAYAEAWAARGCHVIVAALDATFLRTLFPGIIGLIPLAEGVTKLTAVCAGCGAEKANALPQTPPAAASPQRNSGAAAAAAAAKKKKRRAAPLAYALASRCAPCPPRACSSGGLGSARLLWYYRPVRALARVCASEASGPQLWLAARLRRASVGLGAPL